MKFTTSTTVLVMVGVASARPDAVRFSRKAQGSMKLRREVPQEHSHEQFLTGVGEALNLNNVENIQDPVFSLLGNAAAAAGAGDVEDLDCLQQHVADQAFTNAKAAGDIEGMTNALIFRALERNTGAVGQASVLCTETAVNPEIDALQQHQDPASDGAADLNKQITLELAVQLASIGADPQLALKAGTFAPGEIGDPTGAGNTCDEDDDPVGCIFTQNLLVEDASAQEIDDAVAAAGGSAGGDAGSDAGGEECVDEPVNVGNGTGDADDAGNAGDAGNATGANVNAFSGNVGADPIPIANDPTSDRPFSVNGATFQNAGAAVQRACDVQKNACANAANSGSSDISVADCDAQQQECIQANANVSKRGIAGLRARQAGNNSGALDTGSCGSPAISFGVQADRNEESFAPADAADFNHGSALAIGVIADFICSQLGSKCQASDATIQDCEAAASAADGLTGQAAADAFNNALGV
ncbi:hypothetical protein ANO14919_093900 [Xylariales sp. No.14919]|nr:hypothetical protein F5X98DRAFT_62683 [Xylaria grammica]GAW19897.1 hypothetical protein ANO14919_093900 [Xylariales sp. No.14919]